jgi:hypothetical protein
MRLRVVAFVLLTTGAALAQQPASGPQPGPAANIEARRAAERVEQHIEALHRRLAITPPEQPQWDAFAAVMRNNARAVEEGHATNVPKIPGNALDELRSLAIRSRLHADNLARLLPPFEALYTAMSPEQRTLADATFREFQRGADAPSRP